MMSTLRVHRDLGSLLSLPLAGRGQGWREQLAHPAVPGWGTPPPCPSPARGEVTLSINLRDLPLGGRFELRGLV